MHKARQSIVIREHFEAYIVLLSVGFHKEKMFHVYHVQSFGKLIHHTVTASEQIFFCMKDKRTQKAI